MLKLHGFPVSNYTNMVAFALLEKGVPFEYVLTMPEQGTEFLGEKSARQGAVPRDSAGLHQRDQRDPGIPRGVGPGKAAVAAGSVRAVRWRAR